MKIPLKASLTAALVTSVSLGAVATVATFASIEPAYAKSEKSNEGRGKSGDRGKSGERSASRGKSSGAIEGFFTKLTGQDRRAAKSTETAKSGSPRQTSKAKRAGDGAFHPSELGNMNGALNANINAVLAHIRNGNENGPVGHIAVLAAATATSDGAQNVLDRAALFDALAASPYVSLEDYYLALEGLPGNMVDSAIENADDQDEAAISAGFTSYEDYFSKLAVTPDEPDEAIDLALAALDVDIETRGEVPADLALDSSDRQVIEAEESLMAKTTAEQNILAYWNKNPGGDADTETGRTVDEERLLSELRNRFSESDQIAIQNALDDANEGSEVDDTDCEGMDDLCDSDDELATLTE